MGRKVISESQEHNTERKRSIERNTERKSEKKKIFGSSHNSNRINEELFKPVLNNRKLPILEEKET